MRQASRSLKLTPDGAFVGAVTDPLRRSVSFTRGAAGRVESQDIFGVQGFGFEYDDNGNVTKATSPESGSYEEPLGYTPVDLLESFELPAGPTNVQYDEDRQGITGSSPHGTLGFDSKGRLTAVGDTAIAYDDDDYVTSVTSPDGSIAYAYNGKPVPESMTWTGSVAGAVSIGRNGIYQATSVTVGSHTAAYNPDPDGVFTEAGALSLTRNAASLITATTLGDVSDATGATPPASPCATPVGSATADLGGDTADLFFSEAYVRDRGGRIVAKDVCIRDPDTGDLQGYTESYGYDSPGRLEQVAENGVVVAQYGYDSNNSLIGEPSVTPTPGAGLVRLYFHEATPTVTPASAEGSWQETEDVVYAAMGTGTEGDATAATVTQASCPASPGRVLVSTFVSPPLLEGHTVLADDQVTIVAGAGAGATNDNLQGVATVWVMKSDGTRRCAFGEDWELDPEENLPSPAAKGYGGTLASPTGAGYCGGVELEAGDRLVAEVGYRCTAQSAAPVEGSIWRGGTGPALSLGANPDAGVHGRPGYLQIDGGLRFTATGAAPDPCGNGTIVTPPSRVLHSVTTTSDNAISAATLTDPQGNPRSYTYTTNGTGALATKTETSTSATTTYTYDTYGSLREVELPGGTDITYRIDATNRRVGKEVNGTPVQGFLYQSALRPAAELDASNNVVAFFVYAEKPNVPEYMVKGGNTYRIITDHLGSVRLVVDTTTGAIAQRLDYDHHGNVTRDTNPGFQPFGWAGGLYDPDTGLVRFGARDYDPEVGRWTAPDPIGFGGGDGNVYAYASNDSANLFDPDGLAPNQAGATESSHVLNALRTDTLATLRDTHPGNIDRYFFTDRYGWVDVRHFAEAARLVHDEGWPGWVVEALGVGNEVRQWWEEGGAAYRSGFSPEDLPSNAAGVDFARSVRKDESLSSAFGRWAASAGARSLADPQSGFADLPATDPAVRGGADRGSNASSRPIYKRSFRPMRPT